MEIEKIMKISVTAAILVVLTVSFVISQSAINLSRAADSMVVLDQGNNTMLTGTITKLQNDSMMLQVGEKNIRVDMDSIDRGDVDLKTLLAEGQSVTVQGHFTNNEMRAQRIISNLNTQGQANPNTTIISNPIDNNHHHHNY